MKYIGFMLLAACGRFGFDAHSDGGGGSPDAGPSTITVRVTTVYNDGDPITPAGIPVAGAVVLADGQRLATDATGSVVIPATAPIRIDVEWENPDHFEYVVTALAVPPGAVLAIGDEPRSANPPLLHVVLPPQTGATEYAIALPLGCADLTQSSAATTFDVTIYDRCAGATVPAFAVAGTSYIDLGMITLTDGATIDRSTSPWKDQATFDVAITGLPIGFDHLAATGVTNPRGVIGGGLIVPGDPAISTNTFTLSGPPGDVVGIACTTTDQSASYGEVAPLAPTLAASFPPLLATMQGRDHFEVATTDFGDATAMRLIAVYQTPVFLDWTIVGAPTTTDVAFPDVPVRPDGDPGFFAAVLATLPDLDYSAALGAGLARGLATPYPPGFLTKGRRISVAEPVQGMLRTTGSR